MVHPYTRILYYSGIESQKLIDIPNSVTESQMQIKEVYCMYLFIQKAKKDQCVVWVGVDTGFDYKDSMRKFLE